MIKLGAQILGFLIIVVSYQNCSFEKLPETQTAQAEQKVEIKAPKNQPLTSRAKNFLIK